MIFLRVSDESRRGLVVAEKVRKIECLDILRCLGLHLCDLFFKDLWPEAFFLDTAENGPRQVSNSEVSLVDRELPLTR